MTSLVSFYSELSSDIIGCDGEQVRLAVINTIINFCSKTKILKYKYAKAVEECDVVGDGNEFIVFPVSMIDDSLRPYEISSIIYREKEYTLDEIIKINIVDGSSKVSLNTEVIYYDFDEDDTYIKFYNITYGGTLQLDLVCVPRSDATEVPDILYNNHLDTIIHGANARLFASVINEKVNFNRSAFEQNLYNTEVSRVSSSLRRQGTTKSNEIKYRSFII